MVFTAALLQGATGGIITPAIAGISLGLVGRRGMSVRTGRNFRYAAGGHAVTAALMGAAGAYFADKRDLHRGSHVMHSGTHRAQLHPA